MLPRVVKALTAAILATAAANIIVAPYGLGVKAERLAQEWQGVYQPAVNVTSAEPRAWTLELIGQHGGTAYAVMNQGELTYFGVGAKLLVADTRNKSEPRVIGESQMLQGAVEGLDLAGDVAFVAAGGAGLIAFDISVATTPHIMWSLDLPGHAADVDVSDPAAPYEIGAIEVPDAPVAGAGFLVYRMVDN